MISRLAAAVFLLALGGCATTGREAAPAGPVAIKIIAFNDFHGNLEPPKQTIEAGLAEGGSVKVPAGGAAYFAAAVNRLRADNPNHAVVSAGDMIGASPLVSNLFLDEPTIAAMNLIKVDFNAVGNHEFDRGRAELLRMQQGGCAKHTARKPCAVEPFEGAKFRFLAANVLTENGESLFASYGIRSFGSGANEVKLGVIGLTLEETPTLVTPAGVAGLRFADEADTVNALIPKLRAEGADAIVVLIHLGASLPGPRYTPRNPTLSETPSCKDMEGDLMSVLARLDPEVDLVVSGHTHNTYICDYGTVDPKRPFLVTSAGRYGMLLTDIRLLVDPKRGVLERRADNIIVQGEGFRSSAGEVATSGQFTIYPRDPEVAALVERYVTASAPLAGRTVGRLSAPASRKPSPAGETVLGDLVADAQLAATSAPAAGGARIAFMNGSGVRAEIVPGPGGEVTFGQIFAAQPFGNSLVVKTLTGTQLWRLLEQQFASGWNTVDRPNMLMPSRGLSYAYDLSRPEGQRILDLRLDGVPVRDDLEYRVAMNSFLATGGDNFTVLREGKNPVGGPQDLDALEAYIAAAGSLTPPALGRIENRTPKP